MCPTLRHSLLAATMVALVAASPLHAQTPPPAPVPGAEAPPSPNLSAEQRRTMNQRMDAHIRELHDSLRITPAQQPQWEAFAQVMRDNSRRMQDSVAASRTAYDRMTATDRMRFYADVSAQHAKDVVALVAPFQALYDSMSPEQKAHADEVFRAQAQRARKGDRT